MTTVRFHPRKPQPCGHLGVVKGFQPGGLRTTLSHKAARAELPFIGWAIGQPTVRMTLLFFTCTSTAQPTEQ
jgi:hypothetical protein